MATFAGRGGPDVAVIGAGVLGLACGAELARAGRNVVVLERNDRVGAELSSRNSEVVHAGIHDPPESLKARCCVEGRDLLYARCAALGIPHRRVGKIVVATTDDEVPLLERMRARAEAAGAGRLAWLDRRELARREPRVRAVAALWSEKTGIVDAHALVASHRAELEAAGGTVVLRTAVTGLARRAVGWRVDTVGPDGAAFALDVPLVVNAAGLAADRVAEMAGVDVDAQGWRHRFCKGDYFAVAPGVGPLTRHLVYPVPSGGGLGIHVTMDLGGRHRLGPDAEWVDEISWRVDPAKRETFADAARRYLLGIRAEHLEPDMAGIRPKLAGPGEPFADFVVEETSRLGAPGMVQLLGIESPGLTASGAIARLVAERLGVRRA